MYEMELSNNFENRVVCNTVNTTPSLLKQILLNWRDINKNKRVACYHKQVEMILRKSHFNLFIVDRPFLDKIWKNKKWSSRNIWPLTAWNSFCEYGRTVAPEIFPPGCQIKKPSIPIDNLPAAMRQEIQNIIDSHIVHSTNEKFRRQSQARIYRCFEVFRQFVITKEPLRHIDSIEDFSEKDACDFANHLITTEKSPLTGRKIDFNSLSAFLIDLRRIYKLGVKQKRISENIMKDIAIEKHKISKRQFCLTPEQIEKLRTCGIEKLDEMSLAQKFEQIRNNTMVSVQYEVALRDGDVVNLCWEDLPKHERSASNVGPVIVRGGKQRSYNHEDRIYIPLDRLDSDLYRWQQICEEYCRMKNITAPTIIRDDKECHLIFFSKLGKQLSPGSYIHIFKKQLKKTNITLPKGYKTHIIRHSRITHWVDEGFPFEKIHENARHGNLEETWKYFHSNAKKRIEAVEKVYGLDKESLEMNISKLPPRGILKVILRTITEFFRKNIDRLNSDEPEALLFFDIEKILLEKCADFSETNLFYTFREVMDKLNLKWAQAHERIKILKKQSMLHSVKIKNKTVYLKEEIDPLASLVNSRTASSAFGYKEKCPTVIPKLVQKGVLKSTKLGNLHYFEPSELIEYYSDRNSKKISQNPANNSKSS